MVSPAPWPLLLLAVLSCFCSEAGALISWGSSSPYGVPEPRTSRDALRQAYERYQEEAKEGGQLEKEGAAPHDEETRHRVGRQDMYHGTTTCSFVFDGGILVAVDSRASMGECCPQ